VAHPFVRKGERIWTCPWSEILIEVPHPAGYSLSRRPRVFEIDFCFSYPSRQKFARQDFYDLSSQLIESGREYVP
jgi:hypothetical protein